MKRKKACFWLGLAAILLIFLLLGLDTRLAVRYYIVESEKVTSPIRILFLSDLHSCDYGEGQRELIEVVEGQEPDLILLGGDWVDDDFGHRPPERAYMAARRFAQKWPTFYVSGNHEIWSGYEEEIKQELTACGVEVLAGKRILVELNGQEIDLCGMDDPMVGEREWEMQLEHLKEEASEIFSVLLTHRPERANAYTGFDLVLAGHAHGGQWRIPGLINGVFAPDQGWFPALAGGEYGIDENGTMIVGRGLARETTKVPRFYNRPEVVVVDIIPRNW